MKVEQSIVLAIYLSCLASACAPHNTMNATQEKNTTEVEQQTNMPQKSADTNKGVNRKGVNMPGPYVP